MWLIFKGRKGRAIILFATCIVLVYLLQAIKVCFNHNSTRQSSSNWIENGTFYQQSFQMHETSIQKLERNTEKLLINSKASMKSSSDENGIFTALMRKTSKETLSDLDKYEPRFVHNPTTLCLKGGAPDLLVYVHSAAPYASKRNEIRITWGSRKNLLKYNARLVFIVGKANETSINDDLSREFSDKQDIVCADFMDSYRNLTFKCKSALSWVSQYCGNVPYVLKTDDDVFINFRYLEEFVLSSRTDSKRQSGLLACNSHVELMPFRDARNKWVVTFKEYPLPQYPIYCQGPAYLMSNDVVRKLNDVIRNPNLNKPFVWLDDVYILISVRILHPMNLA